MNQAQAKELRRLIFDREVQPSAAAKKAAQERINELNPNGKEGRRAYRLALRKANKLRQRIEASPELMKEASHGG